MRWCYGLALVVVVCSVSGCATIAAPGPDRVRVATNPSGATVYVDNRPVGKTPVVAELDRKQSRGEFRLELPGFDPVTIVRNKTINGWLWGNILLGGLVGIIIDVSTGNAQRFNDDPIAIGLIPSGTGKALPSPPSGPSNEECSRERRRVLVEAQKIQDRHARVKMINSAPICK